MGPPSSVLSRVISVTASPVTRRAFQSTALVVEENTTFGMSRQRRADSICARGGPGGWAAGRPRGGLVFPHFFPHQPQPLAPPPPDHPPHKPRPVLCLGNRALNGRPTGDAEVGVARCPVTERLVGSDAVVDVAEAGGLHRKRSAVIDGCAVEVLVFEGAEETLDDAVSLR